MSMLRQPRLPATVRRELEGLDWALVPGRKHWHLRIDGYLVAIWPHGPTRDRDPHSGRSTRNAIKKFKAWRASS